MNTGDGIYYTGDQANDDGYGSITQCNPATAYAPESVNIVMTDGREWRMVFLTAFDPTPGRRFWLADEWQASIRKTYAAIYGAR